MKTLNPTPKKDLFNRAAPPSGRSHKLLLKAFLLLSGALLLAACSDSDSPTSPTPANVPFSQTDLTVGTGTEATSGARLQVAYTGWLYDELATDKKGTRFDSSNSFEFTVGVGAVIAGWDQGVPGMKELGTRRLVIPPDLAYGSRGAGSIPPNATLVFDVELLKVL